MGASLSCCLCRPDLPDGSWESETWYGGPKSSSSFAKGDVVEVCLCLPVEPSDVEETFLRGRCFAHRLLDGSSVLLAPLGLGLLYRRSSKPTLLAECYEERGRCWLRLQAAQDLPAGAPLTIGFDSAAGKESADRSLLDVAPDWADFGRVAVTHGCLVSLRSCLQPCGSEGRCPAPWDPAARSQAFDVKESDFASAGLGVFSKRDCARGEVVDVNVAIALAETDILDGYPFDATEVWFRLHKAGTDLRALALGNAMVFNHAKAAGNLDYVYEKRNGLILQVWFATRNIGTGEELLYDYGDDYWEDTQPEELDLS